MMLEVPVEIKPPLRRGVQRSWGAMFQAVVWSDHWSPSAVVLDRFFAMSRDEAMVAATRFEPTREYPTAVAIISDGGGVEVLRVPRFFIEPALGGDVVIGSDLQPARRTGRSGSGG